MDKVFVRKFDQKNYKKQIREILFNEFSLLDRLKKVKTIFIKPNLVSDIEEYIKNGANTDLRIIEALLFTLKDFKHLKVYLGESETGTKVKGRKLKLALQKMGVYQLKKKYDFEIVNLSEDKQKIVNIKGAKFLKKVVLSKTLMNADLIFNLPKMKTHKYSVITCALKNMFGVISDPLKVTYHQNIHQVLADLNRLFYEKMLIITDGIVCMEGQGPLFGQARKLNILVFADNPLLNDVVAAKIMKIDAGMIRHLQLSNLWAKKNFSEIRIDSFKKIYAIVHKPFIVAHKNFFIRIEEQLMRHPWIIKIIFNDWFRKNINKRLDKLIKKLRGGGYTWYE